MGRPDNVPLHRLYPEHRPTRSVAPDDSRHAAIRARAHTTEIETRRGDGDGGALEVEREGPCGVALEGPEARMRVDALNRRVVRDSVGEEKAKYEAFEGTTTQ